MVFFSLLRANGYYDQNAVCNSVGREKKEQNELHCFLIALGQFYLLYVFFLHFHGACLSGFMLTFVLNHIQSFAWQKKQPSKHLMVLSCILNQKGCECEMDKYSTIREIFCGVIVQE